MKTYYQAYLAAQHDEQGLIHGIKLALGLRADQPVPDEYILRFQNVLSLIRRVEETAFSRGTRSVQQNIIKALDLNTLLGK